VSEVTWEELSKESFGGHSNTSAYSLVYIDAAKPELLTDGDDGSNANIDGGKILI
jgi:ubiquitin carboxyl-terminal hydrolase 25/28